VHDAAALLVTIDINVTTILVDRASEPGTKTRLVDEMNARIDTIAEREWRARQPFAPTNVVN
jgi:hypothetical protein